MNASNVNLVFETIGKHILRKKNTNTQNKSKLEEQPSQETGVMVTLTEARKKVTQGCC